jgi:hypothetical protein
MDKKSSEIIIKMWVYRQDVGLSTRCGFIDKMWVYRQDVGLSTRCGFIDKMWMHNMHYYCLLADYQYFSMFSLSKVSKLHFHTQFKNQNISNLKYKCMISTFSQRTVEIL